MIDMYDLPTEKELAQIMLESRKNKQVNEIDTKTIFPFWEPRSGGKNAHVVSDNTGIVKPKNDFKKSDTDITQMWENFLTDNVKTDGKKPVTELDNFGTVVVDSYAAQPDANKLVGSIKALKKTTVKEMSGKKTTKVEELGVGKVITKSNAQNPNKNNLVGIVKPVSKASIDNLKKKPEMNDTTLMQPKVFDSFDANLSKVKTPDPWTEKSSIPATKLTKGNHVVSDKTGVVKPKKMEK